MYKKNHYVEIVLQKTKKVVKSFGPMSETKAGKIYDRELSKFSKIQSKERFIRIRIDHNKE